jgi:hypothetical protein
MTEVQSITLFYSDYSKGCNHLRQITEQHDFIKYQCIDNPKVRKALLKSKKITRVPTFIVIYSNGSIEKQEGDAAFTWFTEVEKKMMNSQAQQTETPETMNTMENIQTMETMERPQQQPQRPQQQQQQPQRPQQQPQRPQQQPQRPQQQPQRPQMPIDPYSQYTDTHMNTHSGKVGKHPKTRVPDNIDPRRNEQQASKYRRKPRTDNPPGTTHMDSIIDREDTPVIENRSEYRKRKSNTMATGKPSKSGMKSIVSDATKMAKEREAYDAPRHPPNASIQPHKVSNPPPDDGMYEGPGSDENSDENSDEDQSESDNEYD